MHKKIKDMSAQELHGLLNDVPRISREDMKDYGIKLQFVDGFDDRPEAVETSIKCLADKFEAAEAIAKAMRKA